MIRRILFLTLLAPITAQQPAPLSAQKVATLWEAGLGADYLVLLIGQVCVEDGFLDTRNLLDLERKGLPETVIQAARNCVRERAGDVPPGPPLTDALPTMDETTAIDETPLAEAAPLPAVAPFEGQMQTIDLGGGIGMTFVRVEPGSFLMGSPVAEGERDEDETPHLVTLTKAFWMARTEVTQAQWKAVTGVYPRKFTGDDYPVESITFTGALKFIATLNESHGERTFRLPTEAEWEYACRAGGDGPFHGQLEQIAWFAANAGDGPHPVATRLPNAWGLYDMHGNVREWCADLYGPYPEGTSIDPTGPAEGHNRVFRGGSWSSRQRFCRTANRNKMPPNGRGNLGLRLVFSE